MPAGPDGGAEDPVTSPAGDCVAEAQGWEGIMGWGGTSAVAEDGLVLEMLSRPWRPKEDAGRCDEALME